MFKVQVESQGIWFGTTSFYTSAAAEAFAAKLVAEGWRARVWYPLMTSHPLVGVHEEMGGEVLAK